MENSPHDYDHESDSDEKKDSKKKKKAETLGSFLVTSKKEEKNDKKVKTEEKKAEPSAPEAKEAEDTGEKLSEEEKHFVEREYVQAYSQEDLVPMNAEEEAVHAAVEEFRGHVQDGMDSEDALEATLSNIAMPENIAENQDAEQNDFIAETFTESQDETQENDTSRKPASNVSFNTFIPAASLAFDFMPSSQEKPAREAVAESSELHMQEEAGITENLQTGLMIGGIVGFLAGRRAGKANGEDRDESVKQKLHQEVKELGRQIKEKEEIIRHTVRSRISNEHQLQPRSNEAHLRNNPEAPKIISLDKKEDVIFTRENSSKKPIEVAPKVDKNYKKLNRAELMQISRKIHVEGANLKQMYDSHLISEKGLRRLVAEYLRGGNLPKALKREMVQREIDFERDPVLRDQDIRHVENVATANELESMIEKATSTLPYSAGGSLSFEKPIESEERREDKPRPSMEKIIDTSLVATIITLSIAVIILLIRNY